MLRKRLLDTNVIISGSITDHGAPFEVIKRWEHGDFVLVVSDLILKEIERVFNYPKIKDKRHLTNEDIGKVMERLKKYSVSTPANIVIEAISDDPGDDNFIVAAVEGEADYIVSGDHHLKSLGSYQGIRIISPDEFLRVLI